MKKIRIAIIAHSCRTGGGLIGTLNLLKALKNVAEAEQILLICSAGYGYEEVELPANSDIFIYKGSHSPIERTWFERVVLPRVIRRYRPNVVFGAGNIGLTIRCFPQALLIHMPYLFYGKEHCHHETTLKFRLRLAALKSQVQSCLPATDLIFAQTPIVKERFSAAFRYPTAQISILKWPVPAEINPKVELEIPPLFEDYSGDFYVLLLTRYMAHRNPSVLIPLCKCHGEEMRSRQIKFITTVERQDHPNAAKFLNYLSKHHLQDTVINVGALSRHDVLRYYSYSHLLWLPTMMETLGLPFLEAMAMSLPILAPDLDFARYVCGKAAAFYDPWDIESIYNKIILMREDASLRQELIDKGRRELCDRTKFAEDWNETAANLIRDLRTLVK